MRTIKTLISCSEECCGCLNGYIREKTIEFYCNECDRCAGYINREALEPKQPENLAMDKELLEQAGKDSNKAQRDLVEEVQKCLECGHLKKYHEAIGFETACTYGDCPCQGYIDQPEKADECKICKTVDELTPSMSYCAKHNYPPRQEKIEEWEKESDKIMEHKYWESCICCGRYRQYLKPLIQKTIQEAKKEERERMRKIVKANWADSCENILNKLKP